MTGVGDEGLGLPPFPPTHCGVVSPAAAARGSCNWEWVGGWGTGACVLVGQGGFIFK